MCPVVYNITMKEIRFYKAISGKEPYYEWYLNLDNSQKILISKRLQRLSFGHYGNTKDLGDRLKELKFDNGLRIYFCETDDVIILLLNGGNKKRQSKDIKKAKEYLNDFEQRSTL